MHVRMIVVFVAAVCLSAPPVVTQDVVMAARRGDVAAVRNLLAEDASLGCWLSRAVGEAVGDTERRVVRRPPAVDGRSSPPDNPA